MSIQYYLLLALSILLFSNNSIAQQPETALVVDFPESIQDGATFGIIGKANHSYACMLTAFGEHEVSLATTVVSPSGNQLSGSRPTTETDALRYLRYRFGTSAADSNNRNNLIFFTAPSGDEEFGKYVLSIGTNQEDSCGINIQCYDTTTICAYNTVASDFNFLEVTSFGNVDGAAQLSTLKFNGQLNSTSSPAIFPAGARRDFDIHSLAGTDAFGTLFIQALNFIPEIDSFGNPKVSTYKNGELTSSLSCE